MARFPRFYMWRLQNWTVSGVPRAAGLRDCRTGGGGSQAPSRCRGCPRRPHAAGRTRRAALARVRASSCRQTVPRGDPRTGPLRFGAASWVRPRPRARLCGGGSRGGPSPAGARGPDGSAASGRTGGPRSPPGADLWNGRDVRPWDLPGKPGEPVRVSLRTDVHSQGGRQREKQLRPARPAAGPALRSFPGSTGRDCEVLGALRAARRGGLGTQRQCGDCPPAAGLTLGGKGVRTGLSLVCDTRRSQSLKVTGSHPVSSYRLQ